MSFYKAYIFVSKFADKNKKKHDFLDLSYIYKKLIKLIVIAMTV